MRISLIGLASRPAAAIRANSSGGGGDAGALAAEDVGGPDDDGQADSLGDPAASSIVWAMPLAGTPRPISTMAALNRSRSSAVAMASALAPISSGVPGRPTTPALDSSMARLSAGLAAEGGQHGVGPLPLDDPLEHVDVSGST